MDKVVAEKMKKTRNDSDAAEKYILQKYRERRRNRTYPKVTRHFDVQCLAQGETSELRGIEKFKKAARIIRIFISVCNRLINIAAEHGKYNVLKSDANVELHSAAAGSFDRNGEEHLLFDPAMYKSKSETSVPGWVIHVCLKSPQERTAGELRKLCCLMKQVDIFQKYTKGMLNLMAKAATFSRFERGRVIVRKGHTGRSIYIILNGSVALLKSDDGESALKAHESEDEDDTGKVDSDAILRKGDCFGRDALFKSMERQNTAVCLSLTQLLVVNLDDLNAFGLEEHVSKEVLSRRHFLRLLPLFEKLPDENIRIMAERSHTYEYLSDKTMETNSGSSDLIYICRKGQCIVLRKIDKRKNTNVGTNFRRVSLATESAQTFLPFTRNMAAMRTISHSRSKPDLKRLPEITMHIVKCGTSGINKYLSTSSDAATASIWKRVAKKSFVETNISHKKQMKSYLPLELGTSRTRIGSSQEGKRCGYRFPMDSNEWLIVQVAQLSRGDIFGLGNEFKEGTSDGEKRNFILVSSGCEVIVIKRQTFMQNLNQTTKDTLRTSERAYASDEELYNAFCEQRQWKLYREQLVGRLLKWRDNNAKER